jgi:hypothetical protein
MMRVVMAHVLPHYPREIHIQWDVEDVDPTLTDGMTFEVQRSGSPRGEWNPRASMLETVYYTDTFADDPNAPEQREENLLSLNREVWYRVVATLSNGTKLASLPMDNEGMVEPELQRVRPIGLHPRDEQTFPNPVTVFSKHPRIDKRLRLISRAVIRRDAMALRYFNGIEIAVLKRRHFGMRCGCIEPFTKEVLVSNCADCYGTGWLGGFYPSIVTLGRLMDTEPHINTEAEGRTNIVRGRLTLINFPRIEKDDVLVELDSNRRWVVNGTDDVHFRRRKVTQGVTCTELARSSVFYCVPVDLPPLEPEVLPFTSFSSAFSNAFSKPSTS